MTIPCASLELLIDNKENIAAINFLQFHSHLLLIK